MLTKADRCFNLPIATTKKIHTDAEMRYLVYDLGHNTRTLKELIPYDYDCNEIGFYLTRIHGINISKVTPYKVRQHFRMYKLWGLNAAEVINIRRLYTTKYKPVNMLKEVKNNKKWNGFEFEAGIYPRKELYLKKSFVKNAIKYGMDALHYRTLIGCRLRTQTNSEDVLHYLDNKGYDPEIILGFADNYKTPLPYRLFEQDGREFQEGWIEGTRELF